MKRMISLVILLLCLLSHALAAPQAVYPEGEPLSLSVEPLMNFGKNDSTIYRIAAPNGQDLYVVCDSMTPVLHVFDAEYDGVDDLVVTVASGATNAVSKLFVLRDGQYMSVDDSTAEGLFNVAFYPQLGLVGSHGTSGYAGALHEDILLRWKGNRLVPVRRAICNEKTETNMQGSQYTHTTWMQVLHSRVYTYNWDYPGEESLLFEETYDMETQGMEDAYLAFYQREQAALWQGL